MNEADLSPLIHACHPVALLIGSMVVSAVQNKTAYDQAKTDAKSQEDFQRAKGQQMIDMDAANMSEKVNRRAEDLAQGARDREEIQKKAQIVTAQGRAQITDAGLAGGTMDALTDEFNAREAALMEGSYLDDSLALNRYRRELEGSREHVKGRLLANYRPINQPSGASYAMNFAADSMAAGASYYASKK